MVLAAVPGSGSTVRSRRFAESDSIARGDADGTRRQAKPNCCGGRLRLGVVGVWIV